MSEGKLFHILIELGKKEYLEASVLVGSCIDILGSGLKDGHG